VRSVGPERVPLSAPDIGEAEIAAVVQVLRSGRLSLGPRLEDFEHATQRYSGAKHAVAVSSGTAGLHLALQALGVGPGDEVITTPFSFVASANVILYRGARPAFVDIDPRTLNIDPARIAAAITPRTRAVLVVHVFGRPAAMELILRVARRHGLAVIEDACEAIGGQYNGQALGTLGDVGVFGFYPNKQMTTGEGGMLVTERSDVARQVVRLRNQGRRSRGSQEHVEVGYNYRLSEMQCALGVAQLSRLPAMLARRAEIARMYERRLRGRSDLLLPAAALEDGRPSWFAYVVRLARAAGSAERDAVVQRLAKQGIACGRYFAPIHLQLPYRRAFGHAAGDFPHTEHAAARTLALPFFNRITEEQVDRVSSALLKALALASGRKRGAVRDEARPRCALAGDRGPSRMRSGEARGSAAQVRAQRGRG